jgi:hypothetical protein
MFITTDERKELALTIYDLVWAFRAYMDKETDWKTPPVNDSLAFALTEIGEAVDAELRTRPYARNSERDVTVVQELADVVLMLVTALPVGHVSQAEFIDRPGHLPATEERTSLHNIAQLIAVAWHEYMQGKSVKYAQNQTALALHMTIAAIGSLAEVEVAKRMIRIYEKNDGQNNDEPQIMAVLRGLVEEEVDDD